MRRSAGTVLAIFLATPCFADTCELVDALDTFAATGTPPREAICTTYLTAAATTGMSCYWSFGFRDTTGRDFSGKLWSDLKRCRAGEATGKDQTVNHPDSYDLREWQTSTGHFAVSVKDKGALDRTLVFLRYEPD